MKASSIIWGLLLITIGAIIGLNNLGITDISLFFNGWWTLFIILPSLVGLFKKEDKLASFVWLLVGVCLLLACNGLISFDILRKLFVPILLMLIGLTILLKNNVSTRVNKEIDKIREEHNDEDTICGIFKEEKIEAKNGKSVDLEAIFGSVNYDLRDVKLKKNLALKASAIFGTVKILVPEDVNVKFKTSGIFNDHINKVGDKDEKVTVYIDSFALFGSVIVSDK